MLFIAVWVHSFFNSSSIPEVAKFCLAILQYAITREPQPLTISNGKISSDYFLIQKKPDRLVLNIKSRNAAIILDDQEKFHLFKNGVYLLPKKWEIINTMDTGIQEIEFGPKFYEDPFNRLQHKESLILQQALNERLQSSKFITNDNKLIFLTGKLLYQIDFLEDKNEPGELLIPAILKGFVETTARDSYSGFITDDLNNSIRLLITSLLKTSIRQFSLTELINTDKNQSDVIEQIFKELEVIMAAHKPIKNSENIYFSQDQINLINEQLCNIDFKFFLANIFKIHLPNNKNNILPIPNQ